MHDRSELRVVPSPSEGELTTVYLAVTSQEGVEAVFTVIGPNGEKLPLVALNGLALDQLRDYSRIAAINTGQKIKIISFTGRSDLDSISPPPPN